MPIFVTSKIDPNNRME